MNIVSTHKLFIIFLENGLSSNRNIRNSSNRCSPNYCKSTRCHMKRLSRN